MQLLGEPEVDMSGAEGVSDKKIKKILLWVLIFLRQSVWTRILTSLILLSSEGSMRNSFGEDSDETGEMAGADTGEEMGSAVENDDNLLARPSFFLPLLLSDSWKQNHYGKNVDENNKAVTTTRNIRVQFTLQETTHKLKW